MNLMEKYREKGKAGQGEKELQPGKVAPYEPVDGQEAAALGNNSQGTPLRNPASGPWTPPPCGYVLIYSRILEDFLLLTDTEARAEALQAQGIVDVIYTAAEIEQLKGLNAESLE